MELVFVMDEAALVDGDLVVVHAPKGTGGVTDPPCWEDIREDMVLDDFVGRSLHRQRGKSVE